MKILKTNIGTEYVSSGKVNWTKLIISLLIGYFVVGFLGIGYGLLSHINPIIYLNILILGIGGGGVILLTQFAIKNASVRNRLIAVLVGIFFGIIFIYNAWTAVVSTSMYEMKWWGGLFFKCSLDDVLLVAGRSQMSIGKFGRSGLNFGPEILALFYVVEAVGAIGLAAYIAGKDHHYFCENCSETMDETTRYFHLDQEMPSLTKEVMKGKLYLLNTLPEYAENSVPVNGKVVQAVYHTCSKCTDLVASVNLGIGKLEKNESKFKYEKEITTSIYATFNEPVGFTSKESE